MLTLSCKNQLINLNLGGALFIPFFNHQKNLHCLSKHFFFYFFFFFWRGIKNLHSSITSLQPNNTNSVSHKIEERLVTHEYLCNNTYKQQNQALVNYSDPGKKIQIQECIQIKSSRSK